MKKSLVSVLAVVAMSAGCADKKPANASLSQRLQVTDVSPAAPTYTPLAPVQPIQPVQPVQAAAPVQPVETASFASAPAGGGAYIVKRGDTLYSIARSKYGDGKQWQRIASANPGLSPQTLKVGQKLTLP